MVKDDRSNGNISTLSDWESMSEKISDIHGGMGDLMNALKPLESLHDIAKSCADIKDGLIGPATSIDRVPQKTVDQVITEVANSYKFVTKAFAIICASLTTIIACLLIGAHFGWFKLVNQG